MCLIAWNWQPDSPTPLLLIGNRDEFYARPAQTMHWWQGNTVLAGRDLQAGGTWLGLNRAGHLAVLTNFRSPEPQRQDAPSRGELVAGFLAGHTPAQDYLHALALKAHHYNPFNLLLFDGSTLLGLESRSARVLHIAPGISGVSNADFDTPWPKLQRWKQGLHTLAARDAAALADDDFLRLMQDRIVALDADLPATGIALARERALSSPFIAVPDYGTRACSVVRLERQRARVSEYRFDEGGATGQAQFEFAFELVAPKPTSAPFSAPSRPQPPRK